MIMENRVTFLNCCSCQALTDRNPKRGTVAEKVNLCYQFLSLTLIFRGMKVEIFAKYDCE